MKIVESKEFWEEVRQQYRFNGCAYLCDGSFVFRQVWNIERLQILELGEKFLLENEQYSDEFFVGVSRSLFCCIHKFQETKMRNIRIDFVKWCIAKFSKYEDAKYLEFKNNLLHLMSKEQYNLYAEQLRNVEPIFYGIILDGVRYGLPLTVLLKASQAIYNYESFTIGSRIDVFKLLVS